MGDERNERNVEALLALWTQLALIRENLVLRLRVAEGDAERGASDVAMLRETGTDDAHRVADMLAALVAGEVEAAQVALDSFDGALRRHLGRADPPWGLTARFSSVHLPGIELERAIAFKHALKWLRPLVERQRRRLRAAKWHVGDALPAAVHADPTTPGFAELAVAASACIHAMHLHERFHGQPVTSLALADAGRGIVRELQGAKVAKALLRSTSGASAQNAAAVILASFLDVGPDAIVKAVR